MSKISSAVKKQAEDKKHRKDETAINFMGGESFQINPLDTLKMISASSIFGEASYYRDGKIGGRVVDARYRENDLLKGKCLLSGIGDGKTTTEIFEKAIDDSLDYDFTGTLEWALTLRTEYYMRLNPQVIMVRAAVHPKRKEFTASNPGEFIRIEQKVMSRPDEPASQAAYYLYMHGDKKEMPTILKRALKQRLDKLDAKSVSKYKNHEIGMIDTVRLVHAYSQPIDELMRTGNVKIQSNDKTWENLKSEGIGWKDIFESVNMGHMALLRNLRGVFTEVNDKEFCKKYLEKLKDGVKYGKQFPFRYYTAINAVEQSSCNHRPQIMQALEECMDISLENMPKLSGKTMCLSDNSGSAWGTIPTEYGSIKVAEIDNLSSVITAVNSEEGYVGKFGDKLKVIPVNKREGVLAQAKRISEKRYMDVGGNTEGGIWEFFYLAINNKEHWDNIFIYSDMQAGHGGLYGTESQRKVYQPLGFGCKGWHRDYINVFDLILEYRKKVNPKVNVFSVQTAGYDNVCVPENAYRTAILYGWTGKELNYAVAMNTFWDEIENRNII